MVTVELAIVLLRPSRLLRNRVDQLDGHSHPGAVDSDAAFHEVAGAELPRDGRTVGAAKLIDRAPAQHPQRRDLRELTANLVGHAFREKTLGPILRQVSERPHPYRHRQSPCPQAVPRSAASERSQLAIRFQLAKMRVTTNYFYPLTFSIA